MITKRMNFFARLATYPRESDECWVWPGNKRLGYGRAYIEIDGVRKLRSVHRVAYEHLVGKIPDGMKLDHLCRNPSCFNPRHLESVTQWENILRGECIAAKYHRRTHCKNGHEYTPENTSIRPRTDGKVWRLCKTCMREESRKRYWRDKARDSH